METLSWEVLEVHIARKVPAILSMGGKRGVRLGFDPIARRIFVRLPVAPETKIPPTRFTELDIEVRKDDSGLVLEVSTVTERLYREFHRFAGLLAEDFEQAGRSALDAFDMAIDRWQDLASWKALLTEEQQIGLYGELLFLEALLKHAGPGAVEAWTGRNQKLPERHDFRVGSVDIEVKSTRSVSRRHFVHGLNQLTPSLGHKLFILSIRFEGAGLNSGKALSDRVGSIRISLAGATEEKKEFERKLTSAGYRDADAALYRARVILADLPTLIPVDDKCPRIVSPMLAKFMPPEAAGRIDGVSYTIDLDGLGAAQGTSLYTKVLGKIALE